MLAIDDHVLDTLPDCGYIAGIKTCPCCTSRESNMIAIDELLIVTGMVSFPGNSSEMEITKCKQINYCPICGDELREIENPSTQKCICCEMNRADMHVDGDTLLINVVYNRPGYPGMRSTIKNTINYCPICGKSVHDTVYTYMML